MICTSSISLNQKIQWANLHTLILDIEGDSDHSFLVLENRSKWKYKKIGDDTEKGKYFHQIYTESPAVTLNEVGTTF